MSLTVASKIRSPSRPSMITSAKSNRLADPRCGQKRLELHVSEPECG